MSQEKLGANTSLLKERMEETNTLRELIELYVANGLAKPLYIKSSPFDPA